MTLLTPTDSRYYIKPRAVSFAENDLGDVNRVYVSIASGTTIMVYVSEDNLIPYDEDKEYQKWVLTGYPTKLATSDAYYIYARLSRSDNRAIILFSTKKYKVDGSVEGEEGGGNASGNYYYIPVGNVTATDGATLRTLSFDSGKLSTPDNSYTKEQADAQFMSFEVADKRYLNALDDDEASGLIRFLKGLSLGESGNPISSVITAENAEDSTLYTENALLSAAAFSKLFSIAKDDKGNSYIRTPYPLASDSTVSSLGVGEDEGGTGGTAALYQLVDVLADGDKVSGAEDGNVLMFDAATGKWYGKKVNLPDVDFSDINDKFVSIDGLIKSLQEKDTAHDESITALQAKDAAIEQSITSLQSKDTEHSNAIAALQTKDTAIEQSVTSLQGQLNTLVSGDASSAIESFNEVVEFLKDIEDDSTLEGILAGKQNKITETNKLDYSLIANTPSLADFMGSSSIGGTASSENFSAVYWDGTQWKTRTIYKWALASAKPSYTTSEVTEGTRLYFTDDRAKTALKSTTDALSDRIAVFEKMFQWGDGDGSHIKTPYAFASDSTLSSLGVGSDGTGGLSYDRLDSWDSYTDDKAGYVLSALLGWDLKTRLDNLDLGDFDLSGYLKVADAEQKYATITSLEALSGVVSGKQEAISDLATIREDSKMFKNSAASGITSTNITDWNAAYGWGNHADKGYAKQDALDNLSNAFDLYKNSTNQRLDAHDTAIQTNATNIGKNQTAIKANADAIAEINKWFTLEDGVLHSVYAIASDSTMSSLGVGSDEGGGAGSVIDLTKVVTDILPAADDTYNIGSLDSFWAAIYVNDVSASVITEGGWRVATKNWVEDNYVLNSALANYVTKDGWQSITGKKSFEGGIDIYGQINGYLSDGEYRSWYIDHEGNGVFTSLKVGSYDVLHKSNTSYSPVLTSGTKIGTITIGGTATDLYAPVGGGDTSELEAQVSENSQLIAELTTDFNNLNENKQEKITATNKLAYSLISGTPTLGTAASKGVTTSVTQNSTDLVTSGAVYTSINSLGSSISGLNGDISAMKTLVNDHQSKLQNLTSSTGLASGYIKQLKADTLDLGGSVVATTDDLDAFGNTIDNLFARKATTLAGYGLQESLEDLNSPIPNTFFKTADNTPQNAPFSDWGVGFTLAYNNDWAYQTQLFLSRGHLYTRQEYGSVWSEWHTLLDSSNFSEYALPLSGGDIQGYIRAYNYRFINSSGSYLGLLSADGNDENTLYFATRSGTFHALIHSGNIGSQSVGSIIQKGITEFGAGDAKSISGWSNWSNTIGDSFNTYTHGIVCTSPDTRYYSYIGFTAGGSSMFVRTYNNTTNTGWHQIAFMDDVYTKQQIDDKISALSGGNAFTGGSVVSTIYPSTNNGASLGTSSNWWNNLYVSEVDAIAIELNTVGASGHGGYIDFHFNGSSADYTSRIIEKVSGKVSIVGNAEVEGSFSATGNISAQGSFTGKGLRTATICYEVDADGNTSDYTGEINRMGAPLHLNHHSNTGIYMCNGGGNVLIGTTTDSGYKLYVNGDSYVNGSLTLKNNYNLMFFNSSSEALGTLALTSTNDLVMGWGTTGKGYNTYIDGYNVYLRYGTSHTTGISLKSTGGVEIANSLTVSGDILPSSTDTQSLGSTSSYWKNLYVGIITGHYQSGDVVKFSGSINVNEGNISCKSLTVNDAVSFNTLTTNSHITVFNASPGIILHRASGNPYIRFVGGADNIIYGELGVSSGGNLEFWDSLGTSSSWKKVALQDWVSSNYDKLKTVADNLTDFNVGLTEGYINALKADTLNATGLASFSGNIRISSTTPTIAFRYNNADSTTSQIQGWSGNSVRLVYNAEVFSSTSSIANYLQLNYNNSRIWRMTNDTNLTFGISTSSSSTPTTKMYLTQSGGLFISGALTQNSDETLKNLMGDVRLSLGTMACAPLKKFTFKEGDGEMYVGTIAQYWQGALPEVVTKTMNGTLALSYGELGVAMGISLANILEDTNGRVATVEEEIKTLKEENKRLKERVAELEAA